MNRFGPSRAALHFRKKKQQLKNAADDEVRTWLEHVFPCHVSGWPPWLQAPESPERMKLLDACVCCFNRSRIAIG